MNANKARITRPQSSEQEITPEVIRLATERLGGRKFFRGRSYALQVDRDVARAALLVVQQLNPFTILQGQEEALLRGLNPTV